MTITIHRGIDQIGGCITEIASASGTKILIDLGHNLPEGDNHNNDPLDNAQNLYSILEGVDAVFYTHSHGDHVGFESQVAAKGIPQYIGALSKELLLMLRDNYLYKKDKNTSPEVERTRASRKALEGFLTYVENRPVKVGDIVITPYSVSHSASDAYMFLVECDGRKVLHTGDFRDHGYRGKGLMPTINKYIAHRKVDVLVTEGTMINRDDGRMISEDELYRQLLPLMEEYKYVFVMCSSQDADRIASIHHAAAKMRRRMLVDGYQWTVLDKFEHTIGDREYTHYRYPKKLCYHKHWDMVLGKCVDEGFVMLVRNNYRMKEHIKRIIESLDVEKCCLVYSQFKGYILPSHSAFQQRTYDFVNAFDWEFKYLHTSGHASREALEMVCSKVNPRLAIIPIHREATSDFRSLNIAQELKDKVVTESTTIGDINIVVK